MRLSYKFLLRLTPSQQAQASSLNGSCRFLFNEGLTFAKSAWVEKRHQLAWRDLAGRLNDLKAKFPWLDETPTQTLHQALWDLDHSLKSLYAATLPSDSHPRFRFKKKSRGGTFRVSHGIVVGPALSRQIGTLFLPGLGWVKYRRPRPIGGKILYAVVKLNAEKWYVSLCCTDVPFPMPSPVQSAVGIDLGIASFATLSDGIRVESPRPLVKLARKLATAQRRLNKKEEHSRNWIKAKSKVSKVHARIPHVRWDFLHKASTRIVKNHAVVVMEKLDIRSMLSRQTQAAPCLGGRRRNSRGLNRAIGDQGWYQFQRLLRYKLESRKSALILVRPNHTSQTCSECGDCASGNRLTQSEFLCGRCGFATNADLNAAKNILAAGHVAKACGGTALWAPLKQETRNLE